MNTILSITVIDIAKRDSIQDAVLNTLNTKIEVLQKSLEYSNTYNQQIINFQLAAFIMIISIILALVALVTWRGIVVYFRKKIREQKSELDKTINLLKMGLDKSIENHNNEIDVIKTKTNCVCVDLYIAITQNFSNQNQFGIALESSMHIIISALNIDFKIAKDIGELNPKREMNKLIIGSFEICDKCLNLCEKKDVEFTKYLLDEIEKIPALYIDPEIYTVWTNFEKKYLTLLYSK